MIEGYIKNLLKFRLIANYRGNTIGKAMEYGIKEQALEYAVTIRVNNVSSNNAALEYKKNRVR